MEKTKVKCAFCGRIGSVYQEENIIPCFGVYFEQGHQQKCPMYEIMTNTQYRSVKEAVEAHAVLKDAVQKEE